MAGTTWPAKKDEVVLLEMKQIDQRGRITFAALKKKLDKAGREVLNESIIAAVRPHVEI